jgi:PleD family two-component response regulator
VFPEDGQDAESLLNASDDALYQAKRQGKNRHLRLAVTAD